MPTQMSCSQPKILTLGENLYFQDYPHNITMITHISDFYLRTTKPILQLLPILPIIPTVLPYRGLGLFIKKRSHAYTWAIALGTTLRTLRYVCMHNTCMYMTLYTRAMALGTTLRLCMHACTIQACTGVMYDTVHSVLGKCVSWGSPHTK
jgi:hypothetical protein